MNETPPRADDPSSQPPPGTVREKWWQRSGLTVAVAATVAFGLTLVRPWLTERIGAEATAGAEALAWTWLAVFGVHRGSEGLRRA